MFLFRFIWGNLFYGSDLVVINTIEEWTKVYETPVYTDRPRKVVVIRVGGVR